MYGARFFEVDRFNSLGDILRSAALIFVITDFLNIELILFVVSLKVLSTLITALEYMSTGKFCNTEYLNTQKCSKN